MGNQKTAPSPYQNWGTRVDIDSPIFDNMVVQKGYKVLWEQGILCSCMAKDSGQPDYLCVGCKGKGYLYINAKETRAMVTSISGRKEQERIGLNELGSAYLTSLSTDRVGFRDRFTFRDFTMKYSQLVMRGGDTEDDFLDYPVKDIICIMVLGVTYLPDTDFVITEDGRHVHWLVPALSTGTSYSILYYTIPVYIVINPIHELRGTYSMKGNGGVELFEDLPKQFQIKREDFID